MTDRNQELARQFRATFTTDDLEGLLKLFDEDCVWSLMPTGDKFHGVANIRAFAQKAMGARSHSAGEGGINIIDLFVTDDRMCVEYIHRLVGTEHANTRYVADGKVLELPICLVCRITNGKISQLNEYFQLPGATSPDAFKGK